MIKITHAKSPLTKIVMIPEQFRRHLNLALLLLLVQLLIVTTVQANDDSLPPVDLKSVQDLSIHGEAGKLDGRPLMLAFVADGCHYCDVVEEDFFKPMLRNRDYDSKVVIRTLDLGSAGDLVGFDGQPLAVEDLAKRYGVRVTPTVVFLNRDGVELVPKLVGVSNVEYYGGFLDDAIDTALTQTKLASSRNPAFKKP